MLPFEIGGTSQGSSPMSPAITFDEFAHRLSHAAGTALALNGTFYFKVCQCFAS